MEGTDGEDAASKKDIKGGTGGEEEKTNRIASGRGPDRYPAINSKKTLKRKILCGV